MFRVNKRVSLRPFTPASSAVFQRHTTHDDCRAAGGIDCPRGVERGGIKDEDATEFAGGGAKGWDVVGGDLR